MVVNFRGAYAIVLIVIDGDECLVVMERVGQIMAIWALALVVFNRF